MVRLANGCLPLEIIGIPSSAMDVQRHWTLQNCIIVQVKIITILDNQATSPGHSSTWPEISPLASSSPSSSMELRRRWTYFHSIRHFKLSTFFYSTSLLTFNFLLLNVTLNFQLSLSDRRPDKCVRAKCEGLPLRRRTNTPGHRPRLRPVLHLPRGHRAHLPLRHHPLSNHQRSPPKPEWALLISK